MSHSVFLNSNPNFANSSGDHFTATFADAIEIPAGSAVGAYQVSLTKKPISIYNASNVVISVASDNLYYDASSSVGPGTGEINPPESLTLPSITATIDKGNYTKREFLEHFQSKVNSAINTFNSTFSNNASFKYKCVVRDTEENLFLGLIPNFPLSFPFATGTEINRINNCTPTAANIPTELVQPTVAGGTSNIQAYWSCHSAIYPLQRAQADNSLGTTNNKFNFSPVYTYEGSTHADQYNRYAVSFCNQLTWDGLGATSGTIEVKNALNVPDSFPKVPLTITVDVDYNSSIGIISVVHTRLTDDNPIVLSSINFDGGLDGMNLQVEFYQGDFGNGDDSIVQPGKKLDGKFYFVVRTLGALSGSPGGTEFKAGDILYDSKLEGIELDEVQVAQGFVLDSSTAPANWDGLVPRVWFENLDLTGAVIGDYGMRVSGNFIMDSLIDQKRNIVGAQTITFNVEEDPKDTENTLPQILGSAQAVLAPNGYNPQENNRFGYTELFGNTENYNIEISVPVKAQTNATTSSDLGVERPVVFGLNSVFSGSLKEVESSRLHRSVYPPVLKQLALKNPTDIRTNSIEVRVKRANSNKQATEITECQLELLIN
jgi:hypothetical protein